MSVRQKLSVRRALLVALATTFVAVGTSGPETLLGQGAAGPQGGPGAPGARGQVPGGRGGARGGGRGAAPANLPTSPTAVALPAMSQEITGPGPMFESASSMAPGKGVKDFKYDVKEYFVSGTADGQPYTTRIVVRKPSDNSKFTGLVLVEPMHGSGSSHMFEFTSIYLMSSGHAAVEILTTSPDQFVAMNEARYKELRNSGSQTNEILAQVGSLIRTGTPLGGLTVRKIVMAGTSMTAGVTINYMPAHMVYRTPDMQRIYDGFMPTSNGSQVPQVDVPVVHMPTMHEVIGNITNRQDGDAAGDQYRLYEVSGIAHVDTRDSVRFKPNPCTQKVSTFPHQAYMSVGLHHLLNWADKGVVPPRAERIYRDRDTYNDGSMMLLDEHGNARGGIRNPYVDVPVTKYVLSPPPISPVIPNASAWITANGGLQGATLMCRLAGAQIDFDQAKLRQLYKNTRTYVSQVESRLTALEKAGWSLPVYREMILADAKAVKF